MVGFITPYCSPLFQEGARGQYGWLAVFSDFHDLGFNLGCTLQPICSIFNLGLWQMNPTHPTHPTPRLGLDPTSNIQEAGPVDVMLGRSCQCEQRMPLIEDLPYTQPGPEGMVFWAARWKKGTMSWRWSTTPTRGRSWMIWMGCRLESQRSNQIKLWNWSIG